MLTEVDLKRIMAAKNQLTESIVDESDCEQFANIEVFDMLDDDTPVSEANGLM